MKSFILTCAIIFMSVLHTTAQRIVYVDTEYILDNMTEYTEAQQQLESFVSEWNTDIEAKEKELINLKATFQQNEALMPEVKKIEEQDKINKAEAELVNLKLKRFGTKGDLYKKQQDLIKPIQDKVYNAIKQMSEYRDYDMVLDKSTGVSILFVKPKFDVSNEVLRIVNANKDK